MMLRVNLNVEKEDDGKARRLVGHKTRGKR